MTTNTLRAVAMVKAGIISERRSCLSKVSYAIRNDALHAAKFIANKTGRKTGTYKCSFCKGHHVFKHPHGHGE